MKGEMMTDGNVGWRRMGRGSRMAGGMKTTANGSISLERMRGTTGGLEYGGGMGTTTDGTK